MKRLGLAILCAMAFFAVGLTVYFQATSAHDNVINRIEATDEGNVPNNATVSFGGWMTTPALDRFPNNSPRNANHHRLTPNMATIKAGGTVNFIIGGFHHLLVYDDGIQPSDINTNLLVAPTGPGGLPPILINDPNRRIYRGLDPSLQPQDRVEVVQFDKPGVYLVTCGVLPHFRDGMQGFVRVVANNDNDNENHRHGH